MTMTTVYPATPRPLFSICHTHPTSSTNPAASRASSLTLSFSCPFFPSSTNNCKLPTDNCLMHWFERKIRRYEHRRWTTDDNRRVQPFHWGLEHIGGSPHQPHPPRLFPGYPPPAPPSTQPRHTPPPPPHHHL